MHMWIGVKTGELGVSLRVWRCRAPIQTQGHNISFMCLGLQVGSFELPISILGNKSLTIRPRYLFMIITTYH
jgi:hypothetical protein